MKGVERITIDSSDENKNAWDSIRANCEIAFDPNDPGHFNLTSRSQIIFHDTEASNILAMYIETDLSRQPYVKSVQQSDRQ
jgi:hypothetical protein